MKITIDISEDLLNDVISHSGAKTEREAVVTALVEYNRSMKVDEFMKRIKENPLDLPSNDEIEKADMEEAVRAMKDYHSRKALK